LSSTEKNALLGAIFDVKKTSRGSVVHPAPLCAPGDLWRNTWAAGERTELGSDDSTAVALPNT
jgi:hypothetical protein